MAVIMSGKEPAMFLAEKQKERVKALSQMGISITLSVVRVGDYPASEIYVRNKHRACTEIGILSEIIHLPGNVSQEELESCLDRLASDDRVDGILLQLPLPAHLDPKRALMHIPPEKDADGFHPANSGSLISGGEGILPCTPCGIMYLLHYYQVPLRGRSAVVVGRSSIVGKPAAMMLLNEDCTVTVCHSKTEDLARFTQNADILVSAVGKAGLIRGDMIRKGAAVIDVGINRTENGLVGDVCFDEAIQRAGFITPVPGGVGKLTVAMLMENVIKLSQMHHL